MNYLRAEMRSKAWAVVQGADWLGCVWLVGGYGQDAEERLAKEMDRHSKELAAERWVT